MKLRFLALLVVIAVVAISLFSSMPGENREGGGGPATELPAIPAQAEEVLGYIDTHHRAPDGYEGGRPFHNFGERGHRPLPTSDDNGRLISYQEWDIHPKRAGRNRGAERLVTGSDGSAYYTADHYRTFTRIR